MDCICRESEASAVDPPREEKFEIDLMVTIAIFRYKSLYFVLDDSLVLTQKNSFDNDMFYFLFLFFCRLFLQGNRRLKETITWLMW